MTLVEDLRSRSTEIQYLHPLDLDPEDVADDFIILADTIEELLGICKKVEQVHSDLFDQCFSNPVTCRGKPVNLSGFSQLKETATQMIRKYEGEGNKGGQTDDRML